jgi:signal peptidase I
MRYLGAGLCGLSVLGALTAGVCLLRRQVAVVAVIGPSMQPTLVPGDRVLIRRVASGDVRAGQIVVIEKPGEGGDWGTAPLRWPPGKHEWMIKRVAAMPGDNCPEGILANRAEPVVPASKLVVLGDNPCRSMDSRQIGYVPAERVLGVVLRRISRV